MRYLIGIDVGTTGTKTILVDERGELSHVWYNIKPDNTVPEAQKALAGE